MSPMTSRTGPKGRSETTFVAVTVAVTVTVTEAVRIVLVIPIQSLFPHTTPLNKAIRPAYIMQTTWARGAAQEPLWPTPPPL